MIQSPACSVALHSSLAVAKHCWFYTKYLSLDPKSHQTYSCSRCNLNSSTNSAYCPPMTPRLKYQQKRRSNTYCTLVFPSKNSEDSEGQASPEYSKPKSVTLARGFVTDIYCITCTAGHNYDVTPSSRVKSTPEVPDPTAKPIGNEPPHSIAHKKNVRHRSLPRHFVCPDSASNR